MMREVCRHPVCILNTVKSLEYRGDQEASWIKQRNGFHKSWVLFPDNHWCSAWSTANKGVIVLKYELLFKKPSVYKWINPIFIA